LGKAKLGIRPPTIAAQEVRDQAVLSAVATSEGACEELSLLQLQARKSLAALAVQTDVQVAHRAPATGGLYAEFFYLTVWNTGEAC